LGSGGGRIIRWLALLGILLSLGRAGASRQAAAAPGAPTGDGTLHNGGFDNHIWYEFNGRYGTWLSGSYMPDDDVAHGPQDWRLWYMRDTPLIKSFAENTIVKEVESLGIRSYNGNLLEGGFYQIVDGVTPCLFYNFQIYALSYPYANVTDRAAVLKAGIGSTGWHPDTASDPAFPGYYPATIVWGEAHDYKYPNFGLLTATAEARSSKITVFTYAYAHGGYSHPLVWDSASLAEVTPAMIHDPAALPAPGGLTDPTHIASQDWVLVSWNSAQPAVSQVYYRLLPQSGPVPTYPHKVYLPLVTGGTPARDWVASSLNKTPAGSHTVHITGLLPGRTYEYIAISRGLVGDQCVTWVSNAKRFTTMP